MKNKPKDLITVKQASLMSGKSVSSVRSWIRQKKISGYKKNPKNKNSALMVSQNELMTFLALNGKITSSEVGREPDQSASIQAKNQEISELRQKIEDLELAVRTAVNLADSKSELIANLEIQVLSSKELLNQSEKRIEQLLEMLANAQQKNSQLSDSYHRVTAYYSLPFWKRWASSQLLLQDKTDKE